MDSDNNREGRFASPDPMPVSVHPFGSPMWWADYRLAVGAAPKHDRVVFQSREHKRQQKRLKGFIPDGE
jgi:hypothetical protein